MPANLVVHYYGVGGFCRPRQKTDTENHSSDHISVTIYILDDNGTLSDSQSISDEKGAPVSDSESIPDDNGTLSDSESIQDDIGAAASETDSISDDNGIAFDSESIQESDTDSNIHNNTCQRSRVHCQNGQYDQRKIKQENLIPSQITIMQSNDTPSDESVLDVGVDD